MLTTHARRCARTAVIGLTLLLAAGWSAGCATSGPHHGPHSVADNVLDALHRHAAEADADRYFALFAPEGVFFGTDATERWTVEEFRAYAEPYFSQGRGWTYTVLERHIEYAPGCEVAWFDERLHNERWGECRGTGAMRIINGRWRITQYNLSVPVPNDLLPDVVEMIREHQGAP